MLVGALFDRPLSQFVLELDQALHCRFEDNLALLGGGNSGVSVLKWLIRVSTRLRIGTYDAQRNFVDESPYAGASCPAL